MRDGARPGNLLRNRMSSIQPAQIIRIYRYPGKGLSSQPLPSVALARNSSSSTIASPSWRPISTKPAAIAIRSCGGDMEALRTERASTKLTKSANKDPARRMTKYKCCRNEIPTSSCPRSIPLGAGSILVLVLAFPCCSRNHRPFPKRSGMNCFLSRMCGRPQPTAQRQPTSSTRRSTNSGSARSGLSNRPSARFSSAPYATQGRAAGLRCPDRTRRKGRPCCY